MDGPTLKHNFQEIATYLHQKSEQTAERNFLGVNISPQ